MNQAIIKARQAVAYTIILKSKEGQEHGLFSEKQHIKEFAKYADARAALYDLYTQVKFGKSPLALRAFADQTLLWITNMESRLYEIKVINDNFRYFSNGEVDEMYNSVFAMSDDLLCISFPDAINTVNNILTDSKNKPL